MSAAGPRAVGGDVDAVEVHPAVALRQEPDRASGRASSRTTDRVGPSRRLAHPRVVVQRVDDAASCRFRDRRATSHRSLLSPSAPTRRQPPSRDRRHRQRIRVGAPDSRPRRDRRRLRRSGSSPAARSCRPPSRLPVFEIEDRRERACPACRRRWYAPGMSRCSRFGDVVGHVGALAPSGALGHEDEDVACRPATAAGRWRSGARRSSNFGSSRALSFSSAFFFFSASMRGVLDQLLLFVLQELLAVGLARLALLRLRRR